MVCELSLLGNFFFNARLKIIDYEEVVKRTWQLSCFATAKKLCETGKFFVYSLVRVN